MNALIEQIADIPEVQTCGQATAVQGLLMEAAGPVRAAFDDHIIVDRAIAEPGRFPAINVLKPVLRTMPASADPENLPVGRKAWQSRATITVREELIRLSACRKGAGADVDEGLNRNRDLEAFLAQEKDESTTIAEAYEPLARIVIGNGEEAPHEPGSTDR